jgi:platelet-activating factor acetylhydrolase
MAVLAIEHMDNSACSTARNNYSVIEPYVHPDPSWTQTQLLEFRSKQLAIRTREMGHALQILAELNSGVVCPQFKSRLDTSKLFLMGHSFGAATVLSFLDQNPHLKVPAIVMDPWMYTIKNIKAPQTQLFNLQSETFHYRDNWHPLLKMHNESSMAEFAYVKGTAHQDFSDLPWLNPFAANNRVQNAIHGCIWAFIERNLGIERSIIQPDEIIVFGNAAIEQLQARIKP